MILAAAWAYRGREPWRQQLWDPGPGSDEGRDETSSQELPGQASGLEQELEPELDLRWRVPEGRAGNRDMSAKCRRKQGAADVN